MTTSLEKSMVMYNTILALQQWQQRIFCVDQHFSLALFWCFLSQIILQCQNLQTLTIQKIKR